jgi:hypothetical protein
MWPDGASVNAASRRALIVWFVSKSEAFVLGHFAETKVARLPGRNPASIDVKISHLGH